jgi:hypothetical protein
MVHWIMMIIMNSIVLLKPRRRNFFIWYVVYKSYLSRKSKYQVLIQIHARHIYHKVEQKLNRVLDVINREKAERELHRAEASLGGHPLEGADKAASLRLPSATETEEHFILRMSNANCYAPGNVRVRPKEIGEEIPSKSNSSTTEENRSPKRQPAAAGTTENGVTTAKEEENELNEMGIDDDTVIDRQMRKKLVGLIVNRGKKTKKNSAQN